MGTHFSRDASCFTLMGGGIGSSGFMAAIIISVAMVLVTTPSQAWATDLKANQNGSSHRLLDHQKIQQLKGRIAELKQKLYKEHQHNGNGTPGTLESLQAKVTALESSVSTLLNADNSLLTALDAAQAQIMALQSRIATLESTPPGGGGVPGLEKYVSIDPNPINGVNGPHVIFTGANVHVRSGSGATDDHGNPTGLGNLILGYNEPHPSVQLPRNGAHNLVAGTMNAFSSFGGSVFGFRNRLTGQYATVLGGDSNVASGVAATILGGSQGTASGAYATVLGGSANLATTQFAIAPTP